MGPRQETFIQRHVKRFQRVYPLSMCRCLYLSRWDRYLQTYAQALLRTYRSRHQPTPAPSTELQGLSGYLFKEDLVKFTTLMTEFEYA